MKKILTNTILLLLAFGLQAQVEFRKIETGEDMDKVWADAIQENKPVFVDIYATWCGPCKWMDANVFASEAAGEYLNKEFINVKLDGESEFGRVFAMKSGLSAYPSLFIFNSEQKLMNMLVGAKPWEELQPSLASTLEYYPVLELLQNKFESGVLAKEEYPRFVIALREMGKDEYGSAVAESYRMKFLGEDKLTSEDIRVLAFFTEVQSGNWARLIADVPLLKQALAEDLEEFIDHILTQSIERAVENNDIAYIQKINQVLPELSESTDLDPDEMETRSYIYFYHYSDQIENLISYIDSEYESKRKGDHEWLFEAASNAVFLNPQNRPVAEKGLEWFQTCLDSKENQEYYYHLALCEYFTDSPDKAIVSLRKSLEFTEDPEIIETTRSIIEQVEAEITSE